MIKFRVERSPHNRWVIVATDKEGYSIPGDFTYHIGHPKDSTGYQNPKDKNWLVETTRGIFIGSFKKISSAKNAAKADARKRFSENLSNPGSPSNAESWIPCHAIRQLPSGDIQLLTEKGTMSNPGKRKSFLKKVGKVFGKVVKSGKGILGNPKAEIVSIYLGMSIYKLAPGVYAVLKMDSQARFDSITAAKEYIKEVSKDY